MFVRHRVSKLDNLAGLAVKYNVTVSDIKRANGFLSDSAMFAKDTLLIPTRPMPLGPEYSAWAGMIVAHYGRAPPAGAQLSATGAAALHELRGYYSTGASLDGSLGFSDEEGDAMGARRSSRRSQPQGEVELMTRQQGFSSPAPAYADDRLRRRNYSLDFDDEGHVAAGGAAPQQLPAARTPPPAQRGALFGAGGDGRSLLAGGLQDWRDLQRRSARWKDQLLSKMKRVASQPALAGAAASGIGAPADAAGPSGRAGSGGSAGAASQAAQQPGGATPQRLRGKASSKAD